MPGQGGVGVRVPPTDSGWPVTRVRQAVHPVRVSRARHRGRLRASMPRRPRSVTYQLPRQSPRRYAAGGFLEIADPTKDRAASAMASTHFGRHQRPTRQGRIARALTTVSDTRLE